MEKDRTYHSPLGDYAFDFPFLCAEDYDRLPLAEMGPVVAVRDPYGEQLYPNPYYNNMEVIGSFREYLMGHFYQDYTDYLRRMIEDGRVSIGKSGTQITQPERIIVSDADIERIDLYRKSTSEVYVDVIISVKLKLYDHLGDRMLAESMSQWYRVRTFSDLTPGNLSFNDLDFIAVYDKCTPAPGRALDDYLVPYTRTSLLDSEGTEILALYFPEALEKPCRIDGEELARRMKLQVKYCRLTADCAIRGQMYFEDRTIEVYDKFNQIRQKEIPANTIIVDVTSCIDDDLHLKRELINDTLIHECIHADRHRLFYLGQRLYNEEIRCLSCSLPGMRAGTQIDSGYELSKSLDIDEAVIGDASLSTKSPIDWIEWQANRVTPRIRMPASTTEQKIKELYTRSLSRYPNMSQEKRTANVVSDLAAFFGVSKQSAKIRMIELGYSEAQGVLNFANGAYVENHSFTPGMLSQNQSFTIGFKDALELFKTSQAFRERINSGCYQYIDGHYCLAESKYVYKRNGELHLTSYARAHMDECCLVFTIKGSRIEYSYKEGTLQKESVTAGIRTEFDNNQPAEFDYQTEAKRLSDILYSLPASPCETLKLHMKQRGFTVEELVAKSGVSVRTLKRLRTEPDYQPNRTHLMAICVGLQLEPVLQKDFLAKYGITFTSSPKDVLYEMMLWSMYRQSLSLFNKKLAEYGYPPLSNCIDELDE